MASQIHLIRHAESVHNVSKDFSQLDPSLISLALNKLQNSTSHSLMPDTLAILDKRYLDPSSGYGVENGASLVVDPILQKRSALACDTGSDRAMLEKAFPRLNFEGLGKGWPTKDGIFAADDELVYKQAQRVRRGLVELCEQLNNREKRDIAIVTHGVFMRFLTEEPEIDLPKAGWKNYTVQKDKEQEVKLVLVGAKI